MDGDSNIAMGVVAFAVLGVVAVAWLASPHDAERAEEPMTVVRLVCPTGLVRMHWSGPRTAPVAEITCGGAHEDPIFAPPGIISPSEEHYGVTTYLDDPPIRATSTGQP
jgi:hypothetical protein